MELLRNNKYAVFAIVTLGGFAFALVKLAELVHKLQA